MVKKCCRKGYTTPPSLQIFFAKKTSCRIGGTHLLIAQTFGSIVFDGLPYFLGFSCCWFGCALPEIVFPPNNTFPPSTIDPTGLEIKEGSRYIFFEKEYIPDLCSVPCIKCIRDVTRGSPNETIVHSNIYSLNLHLGSNG